MNPVRSSTQLMIEVFYGLPAYFEAGGCTLDMYEFIAASLVGLLDAKEKREANAGRNI